MELNRQTANTVGRQVRDRDKQISANFMKRTSYIDAQEILLIDEKRTLYLCVAVENYMKFICLDGAISSSIIYRIIGLWFSNKQNESLRIKIQEHISSVPSYKFICALNQMTARLNSKNLEFITLLKDIMIRCVVDHPHQTLYQLYPIVYSHIDGTENKMDYRSKIAQDIISKAKNKINANIIEQLESVIPGNMPNSINLPSRILKCEQNHTSGSIFIKFLMILLLKLLLYLALLFESRVFKKRTKLYSNGKFTNSLNCTKNFQ